MMLAPLIGARRTMIQAGDYVFTRMQLDRLHDAVLRDGTPAVAARWTRLRDYLPRVADGRVSEVMPRG